jgi:hypothetical protein
MKKLWRKIKNGAKKVVQFGAAVVDQALNIVKTFANRILGIIDLLAGLLGIMPRKRIRIHVRILRDEQGHALASTVHFGNLLVQAGAIFKREANVSVATTPREVKLLGDAAPTAALDVKCNEGAWAEDFGDAGGYFRRHQAYSFFGVLTGYAAPVTVFVVRSIEGKTGCSLGPLVDYVTLEPRVSARTLAHEIGHACGILGHPMSKGTLMEPGASHERLKKWQKLVIRNSRHVTYL